jgi:hypothetical protein
MVFRCEVLITDHIIQIVELPSPKSVSPFFLDPQSFSLMVSEILQQLDP